MAVCMGIYIALGFIVISRKKIKYLKAFRQSEGTRTLWMLLLVNTLVVIWFATGGASGTTQTKLTRNPDGEGIKKEELEVYVDGEKTTESVWIEVHEKRYKETERQALLEQILPKMDAMILGENESHDYVDSALNLVTRIPDTSIEVSWEFSRYDVLDMKGELLQKRVPREGIVVQMTGTLRYEETEVQYVTAVRVMPPKKSAKERMVDAVLEQVSEQETNTREESSITLPKEYEGKKLTWKKPGNSSGYGMLVLGLCISSMPLLQAREQKKKRQTVRRKQLVLDYPEILNQIVLLLGAGMTIRQTFGQMVADYQRTKERKEPRVVYEEILYTVNEMQSGITEAEAYERFGKRMELSSYMKLGAVLSQNCKKGAKGLTDLLEVESIQAFEERRQMARRLGDEAGTKLLIPMFIMLAIVLAIVITPAFLSVQL